MTKTLFREVASEGTRQIVADWAMNSTLADPSSLALARVSARLGSR